jgi:hypothetical protein
VRRGKELLLQRDIERLDLWVDLLDEFQVGRFEGFVISVATLVDVAARPRFAEDAAQLGEIEQPFLQRRG